MALAAVAAPSQESRRRLAACLIPCFLISLPPPRRQGDFVELGFYSLPFLLILYYQRLYVFSEKSSVKRQCRHLATPIAMSLGTAK